MFRVQKAIERSSVQLQALPDARRYHLIEQLCETLLWSARVLPMRDFDQEPASAQPPQWRCFLASQPQEILEVVTSAEWERQQLHVLVPSHMTTDDTPVLARCLSIWEAHSIHTDKPAWMYETDQGWFIDPQSDIELKDVSKQRLRWRDFENYYDEKGRLKR